MEPTKRIKRFTPVQRFFHVLLMLAFLIQGATGLSRLYMKSSWGQWINSLFGGYESALTVHIYVGLFMIIGFTVHAAYMLMKIDWKTFPAGLFGPGGIRRLRRVASLHGSRSAIRLRGSG